MQRSLASLICLGLAGLSAATAKIDWSFETSYYNKYVWRGVNLANEGVLQPSLTGSWNGWTVNFWGNYELTDENTYYGTSTGKNRITEWDSTLSRSFDFEGGTANVGITHFDFPNTGGASTTELFATFTFKQSFSPYISVAYDIDETDGFYAKFGGNYGVPCALVKGANWNLGAWVGYGSEKFNNFWYNNNESGMADYGLEAKMSYDFTPNTFGTVHLQYTGFLNDDHLSGLGNRSNFVFGLGFGARF